MNRKLLIVVLMLLQNRSIFPSWQSAWYVTGVGLAFMASKTEQPKKIALCSGLATIIFIGMIRDSYWKYDRFVNAPAEINREYNTLTIALASGAEIRHLVKNFRASIMRNKPENINKFWNVFEAEDILNKDVLYFRQADELEVVDKLQLANRFRESHYKCRNKTLEKKQYDHLNVTEEEIINDRKQIYEYCNFELEKNTALAALESEAQTCRDNLIYTITTIAVPLCIIGYNSMKNGIAR